MEVLGTWLWRIRYVGMRGGYVIGVGDCHRGGKCEGFMREIHHAEEVLEEVLEEELECMALAVGPLG